MKPRIQNKLTCIGVEINQLCNISSLTVSPLLPPTVPPGFESLMRHENERICHNSLESTGNRLSLSGSQQPNGRPALTRNNLAGHLLPRNRDLTPDIKEILLQKRDISRAGLDFGSGRNEIQMRNLGSSRRLQGKILHPSSNLRQPALQIQNIGHRQPCTDRARAY